jgi:hypothetical protein
MAEPATSSGTGMELGLWMRVNTSGSFPIAATRWIVLGNWREIRDLPPLTQI